MGRVTIRVDGREHRVRAGTHLLEACLERGLDLPYFCWHPALGSVGACRQCAVKSFADEEAEAAGRGDLVMACMTPSEEGVRIAIDDEEAARFRAGVIEWLMVNHPHDCPVCDEGGECHLQDMTVMTGHVYRRARFPKRTHRNQDLGPFIHHEMNRCIQCYRCVRFYEHAGGDDLQVFAARDHVYFGRHQDGALESPFAGNLVEVCPTGVFTDKSLRRHYARKWDLATAPSLCVHCGLGCNTIPGARYGELRRIRNRYHPEVNRYFLCDRGRYGYEFAEGERRLRAPLAPRGESEPAGQLSAGEAVRRFAELVAPGRRVVGIGSPRASLEAGFALRRLVGADAFHRGLPAAEAAAVDAVVAAWRRGPLAIASLADAAAADAVLVLGEDVAGSAPLAALALRRAARNRPGREAEELGIPPWNDAAVREVAQGRTGPFWVATPAASGLDELATRALRLGPEEIARLARAVAGAVEEGPAGSGSSDPVASGPVPGAGGDRGPSIDELAGGIARALLEAERPLLVSGAGLADPALPAAAATVARALSRRRGAPCDLLLAVPEADAVGEALLGGRPLEEALEAAAAGEVDTLVVVENDLFRRAPAELVERALAGAGAVVAIDSIAHATAARADLVLPAAPFAEAAGTLVNHEARAQRFHRVLAPRGAVRESWRWLAAARGGEDGAAGSGWHALDDVIADLGRELPELAGVADAAPAAGFRVDGARIPRQPHRFSGRTAASAHLSVREPRPPEDPDSPLAHSMEGYEGAPPPSLLSGYLAPGWSSVQALQRFQEEIAGPLRGGTPGVRLLEPSAGGAGSDRGGVPDPGAGEPVPKPEPVAAPQAAADGDLRLVPLWHVFGSEELSALAPGVAELAPGPYVALSAADARRLGVAAGEPVTVEAADGRSAAAPVRLDLDLPPGVAGVPVGLAGGWRGPLPATGRVAKGAAE